MSNIENAKSTSNMVMLVSPYPENITVDTFYCNGKEDENYHECRMQKYVDKHGGIKYHKNHGEDAVVHYGKFMIPEIL